MKMDNFEVENLDCMSVDELNAWLVVAMQVRDLTAPHVQGSIHYAQTKVLAMQDRLAGKIADAMRLESKCDRIYDSLPAFAQW
jgi:hypothetical protein